MSTPRTVCRIAPLAFLSLALAGCTHDRAAVEQASQDNVGLKAQLNDVTQDRDKLKAQLESVTKERDQYQKQLTDGREAQRSMVESAQKQINAANAELAKARAELDAARKSQGDTEQMAVKLKAAEDAVTAARTKSAEAEKAAATAADNAARARQQVDQLTNEKAALQKRLDAISVDGGKKPAVPELNK